MNAVQACRIAGGDWESKYQYALIAKSIVDDRMGGCYTYETWMKTFHKGLVSKYSKYTEGGARAFMRKTQEGRANWLDSLIQEFAD